MLIDVGGGMALTVFAAGLFGLTFDHVLALDWAQLLRLPIIVSVFAIWLPLPMGMAWASGLIRAKHYGWSVLVSLLTPLVSLLLLVVGAIIILMPLGDGV
jgi:hypothetical protein